MYKGAGVQGTVAVLTSWELDSLAENPAIV